MYSPSLVCMILHTLWLDSDELKGEEVRFPDMESAAGIFNRLLGGSPGVLTRQVPVVARSQELSLAYRLFGEHIQVLEFADIQGAVFFGRVPVGQLLDHFQQRAAVDGDVKFLDLGTPLRTHAAAPPVNQQCRTLLAKAAMPGTGKVGVAIVDR